MPDRPEDWDDWIAEAESGGAVPREALDWLDENEPQWARAVDDTGASPETAFVGIEAGVEGHDWDHVTMHIPGGDADVEDFAVTIDGVTFTVPVEIFWDYFDLADYYGADIDKEY